MTRRRIGRAAARDIAASPSVEAALATLAHTPYGRDIRPGQALAEAQRSIVVTVLWNLRVLAGWAPREGAAILRILLGAVEVSNVEDLLRSFAGIEAPPPYQLGSLATAWPRLALATSPGELRRALAASPWGDAGGDTPSEIGLVMRARLADRLMAAVPSAREWAAGATGLLVAREVVLRHRGLPAAARLAASRVVGPAAVSAGTLPELTAALPASARWALAGVTEPDDLWLADTRWWARVEHDGIAQARHAMAGPEVLIGAAAVMAADAWRVRAALELAARGGGHLEVFDAVA
jgi:hypothetical protein